jgi:hypothetical protein
MSGAFYLIFKSRSWLKFLTDKDACKRSGEYNFFCNDKKCGRVLTLQVVVLKRFDACERAPSETASVLRLPGSIYCERERLKSTKKIR